MTLRRFIGYIFGYVRVEVRGKNPERLVNLCVSSGFPIWGLSLAGGKVYFYTTLARYKEIRPLARKSKCVPRIVERTGIPFTIGKIKRRPAFVVTSVILLSVIFWLSGSVWVISVKGNVKTARDEILKVAAENGLVIGARKGRLSPEGLQQAITIELPDISWAYVRFQGTFAVIEVVEKVRPEIPGPGDIVARKEGIVESVLVLSGVPLVKPGQTVKRGDLLIAGIPSGTIQGARGNVTAKTWYEVLQEVPLARLEPVRTGRKTEFKVVKARNTEFHLFAWGKLFEWYEIEDYPVSSFGKGDTALPVEIFTRVLFEIEWKWEEVSVEEAITLAQTRGRRAIESQLPSSAKLVDFSYEASGDQDSVLVRVTACTVEEIGKLASWPGYENGGR
ncbi:MAG TPA: sporulation protein YqfD [Firmicutes bacterium]|nr:sporulation protein YqfD [Bacillota bacterium]